MSESLEQQFRGNWRTAQLWAALLLGPAAWAVDHVLSYAVTHHECSTGSKTWLLVSSVIAILVSLWGAFLGWEAQQRLPKEPLHEGTVFARSRAMAVGGMWTGFWFAVIVFAEAVPRFLLSPCD